MMAITLISLSVLGSLLSDALAETIAIQARAGSAFAAALQDPTSTETTLYLPAVIQSYPNRSLFGIQLQNVDSLSGADQMQAAGAYWIHLNGLLWSEVEGSNPGIRDWSKVNDKAEAMKNATSRGMNVILVVYGAPGWAADRRCGPVYQDRFDEFGSFLAEVVSRYSQPPYNVLNYEIWNEPDIDPSMVDPFELYGCWGDKNALHYGGNYYGNMLNIVYPMMKAANPDVQIFVGGLLMDCDPALPSACVGDPNSATFLEGILESTQGNSFDGIAFHAYDYFGNPGIVGQFSNLSWGSSWNNIHGPVVNAKTNYIKNLLNKYNVSNKMLINTEAALIDVPQSCPNCENTKAYYLAQAYASAIKQGLLAEVWFSFFGWRGSGLATSTTSTLPAYTAYDVAHDQLAGATFSQDITSYSNVRARSFVRDQKTIWLIWSKDGADHPVTLPKGPITALDVYGNSLPVSQNITVTIQPTYLIFSP